MASRLKFYLTNSLRRSGNTWGALDRVATRLAPLGSSQLIAGMAVASLKDLKLKVQERKATVEYDLAVAFDGMAAALVEAAGSMAQQRAPLQWQQAELQGRIEAVAARIKELQAAMKFGDGDDDSDGEAAIRAWTFISDG